jgi:hypothetical protein
MVTSGTVTVTAGTTLLSAIVAVAARTGFAFSAVSPTIEPNNTTVTGCNPALLSIPTPPSDGSLLGLNCLIAASSFTDTTVSDSGPNQGYHYVASAKDSFTRIPRGVPTRTAYYYVISPDLSNTSSAFYLAQTGTYNAQTNPTGFISGSNLLADDIRHESGTITSHYDNYVVAQNSPSNNVGVVMEAEVGPPSQLVVAFETKVNNDVAAAKNITDAARAVEPCLNPYVGYDPTCTLQGFVNYTF